MRTIGMLLGVPESDQEEARNRADASLRTDPGKPMEVVGGQHRTGRFLLRLHRLAG